MAGLTKKQQKMLTRILCSAVLLAVIKLLEISNILSNSLLLALFCLVPYAIAGWDVLWKAIRNILNGQVFDENFLMALATAGAFATAEYAEAVFVMLFYQTGELFQNYAVGKSRESISELMDIRPDVANLEQEDGSTEEVDPEDVAIDDIIIIKPGERIPLDGVILEGVSSLDTAALTGESVPRDVLPGDTVISGCVNRNGVLRVRVTRLCEESTVSRILDLVENASEKKSQSENFITRFAHYYTPAVVMAALALFVIPSILLRILNPLPGFLTGTVWTDWLHRALIFLVISCPCALVISVPLSFFGGIGGASKCGILVKGGNYLETLARTGTIVFDKTGTLTKGTFSVTEIHPTENFTQKQLLETAALAEYWSDHPISQSLKTAWNMQNHPQDYDNNYDNKEHTKALNPERVLEVHEIAGHGMEAVINGQRVYVGNQRLMDSQNIPVPTQNFAPGTVVHVAIDGIYAGYILISDILKEDTRNAIANLKASGVKKTVMLTGDSQAAADAIAQKSGIDEYHAELLPGDKVLQVETLLQQKSSPKMTLAFVGDGINDAPVLTRADVGIAMGALGSDAAIEAADIILMDDQLSKIAVAIRISRKTIRIVHQNIIFALGVKALVLLLGAFGMASMWAAVFADVGVAFLAILNAMRCLRV